MLLESSLEPLFAMQPSAISADDATPKADF
jgi:hypothetical protein